MKFSRETVALIKQSIDEKWILILEKKARDMGARNCALCQVFGEGDCEECPIVYFENEACCGGTPYYNWLQHLYRLHDTSPPEGIMGDCCISYVKNEIKFLQDIHKRALLLMEI